MALVTLFQTPEDRYGVCNGRFVDHHLLETAFERFVRLEIFLELVQCRGADSSQLTPCQCRFKDVGGVHCAVAFTGAHQRMDFIDEEQDLAFGRDHLFYDRFESFLEFAFVFGACDQRAHV